MFIAPSRDSKILIYAIHRSYPWWREVGKNLGYGEAIVASCIRGDGDIDVVDDFYAAYHRLTREGAQESTLLSVAQLDDVIARCRVLRWLPRNQAAAMAMAMAEAFDKVLSTVNPGAILSFPIDRYVSDVLERLAKARGIPYIELTPGVVPGTSMLLYRGKLITRMAEPSEEEIEATTKIIANPVYIPSYLPSKARYSRAKFLKVLGYFKLRGCVFKAISLAKRDPLNLHYLDAQAFLGHKPKWRDIRITRMLEDDWRKRIDNYPVDRRLFIGLPLFPEASIDYWIEPLEMIQFEDLVVEVATAMAASGFLILVKDHPLQFGFRQTELIDRLKTISGVVMVPYGVSGNEMLDITGVHFTTTGTLGLQAALLGKKSIVTESYYTTPEDFIILGSRAEIKGLPQRVIDTHTAASLPERRRRIIQQLLKGTINEDLYSRNGFNGHNPPPAIAAMGRVLGDMIFSITAEEDWHNRNQPT